jgi:hypothetical protein
LSHSCPYVVHQEMPHRPARESQIVCMALELPPRHPEPCLMYQNRRLELESRISRGPRHM